MHYVILSSFAGKVWLQLFQIKKLACLNGTQC